MKKVIKVIVIIFIVLLLLVAIPFGLMGGFGMLKEAIFDKPDKPKEKHGEFPFVLVYEYQEEQITIEDTIICDFEGQSWSIDGGSKNDWKCVIENNEDNDIGRYYLDENKKAYFYIQVPLEAEYYMGLSPESYELAQPYIYYVDDSTGTMYYEQDLENLLGVKIVSWEYAEPLKDNVK